MSPTVPSTPRPEGKHRWALAVVADLDDETARRLAATTSAQDRLDGLCELLLPADRLPRVTAVRGPMCSECRVTWEDVHADTTRPWPCPGKRPKVLGGPLVPSQRRKSRQERRDEQRKANKAAAAARGEGDRVMAEVRAGIESSMWEHRSRRQRNEEARAAAAEGMEKLADALTDVGDLEGFLA